jgi:hypothetical protein
MSFKYFHMFTPFFEVCMIPSDHDARAIHLIPEDAPPQVGVGSVPRLPLWRLVLISLSQVVVQVAYSTAFVVGNPMIGKLEIPSWAFALI